MTTAAPEAGRPGAAPTAPATGAPVAPAGHRAHLDGLRAVAVYLVVLFHAGVDRVSGGFIGVDVFFVLSGYLVTQVLLRDVAGAGSIRFGRFYSRRARRLLPAAMLALLVTAVVYTAVASPAEVIESVGAFRASFLYVANWFFIDQSAGYFATDAAQSPVLHFWSLAVEEQFYLVWPLLLAGLVAITGRLGGARRWHALRGLVALGALASAAWAVSLRVEDPDRAYYGTDARAYQLLAGALLALTPGIIAWAARRPGAARVAAPAALAGIVVLATDLVATGPIARGIGVTAVTCVLLVALDSGAGGPARGLLSTRPATYLGQISYGTYLWHWPIIIVIGEVTEVAPLPLAGVVALLATGVASLSYHLVEQPVRRAPSLDRRGWPVALTGLALSLVAGLVVVPRLVEPDAPDEAAVAATDAEEFTPLPAGFDMGEVYFAKFGETVDCVDRSPDDCTVVRGSGPHLLLMGDSNAQMWIPAFTRMAEEHDLTLSLAVTPGCLWQKDSYKLTPEIIAECRRTKTDAYARVIPALEPDIIVLTNAKEIKGPPRSTFTGGEFNDRLREDTPASLAQLQRHTDEIVIIEAAPTPLDETFNPLDCLGEAEVVEECRFVSSTEPTWLELQEREIAASDDHIRTADLDRLICPFLPICDPIIGDTAVFWNEGHMTAAYSETLAPEVARYFADQGLIPSRPG